MLPLRGQRYRYSYALQSEMLKQHPLRELAIDVKVNSAVPLQERRLADARRSAVDQTAHSAHVEFAAQEYTPTRDFEVVVELDGRQSDVVLIPHRRGDDGYFMLLLTPPGARGRLATARPAARRRAAGPADPGRHVGLDRRRPAGRAGASSSPRCSAR